MASSSENRSHGLTIVARGSHEHVQTAFWRPVEWKWPAFSTPPGLRVLDWDEAADDAVHIEGAAALLVLPGAPETSVVFKLLDRLQEAGIPAVVLGSGPEGAAPIRTDDGVIVLPSDADPAHIALVLGALMERQPAVDALRAEVRIARRFSGGLRGQIEKVHEELQLAASVQREFLPRALPDAPNINIQVLFRPCGYVSGDIYDVQRLDDRHIGFFVADAVGHGVPAALMTMVLCRCLPTVEHEGGAARVVSPARALTQLNQDLIRRHGEGSRFATAVYGVIDCETRRVTLAGAGHPYPLRIRQSSIERVETEGGLLGIFAEDQFTEQSFVLEPDELLVIYTDGFETAFPPSGGDDYGRRLPNRNYIERFSELAQAWRTDNLPAAMRTLCDQIDRQSGSLHQADDLTAMVIVPAVETPLDRLFAGRRDTPAPAERPRHAGDPGPREPA
ncbi:MAG: SpoIIE family protein phosphatase [Planctomycetota bacterium]|nr:SpoIIE family protein phosphatase [Planctomycetota bacterium]